MATVTRPQSSEIDDAVKKALASGMAIAFSELERELQCQMPNIAAPTLIRQSAWRLIGSNYAELTQDLRVQKRKVAAP